MKFTPSKDAEKNGRFRSVLPHLLLLTLIFFLNFQVRVVLPPLLPEIQKSLGFDHGWSGFFFVFLSFGYFIALLLSTKVSDYLDHKNTIVLSLVSCGVMLFLLGYRAGVYLQSGHTAIMSLVGDYYTLAREYMVIGVLMVLVTHNVGRGKQLLPY